MYNINPKDKDVIIDEQPSYLKYFHGLAESGLGVKTWNNIENMHVFLSILPMDMKISTKLEGVSSILLEYHSPIYSSIDDKVKETLKKLNDTSPVDAFGYPYSEIILDSDF